ncbi:hypothetical protein Agub_g6923, partial [Astrephomene gubernaculifera]
MNLKLRNYPSLAQHPCSASNGLSLRRLRLHAHGCHPQNVSHRQSRSVITTATKEIWLQTSSKAAFRAALDSGCVSSFVFGPDPAQFALAAEWQRGGASSAFRTLLLSERGE